MNAIKNIIVTTVTLTFASAAYVVGACAGKTLWENGLEEKVTEKAQKWFSK